MVGVIMMLWMLLILGVPLMLIVAGYIGYRNNPDIAFAALCFALVLIAHILLAALSVTPMFIIVYAGAHAKPPGNSISTTAFLICILIEVTYALVCFSVCTFIAGRPKPWPLRLKES